jgi:hypothetical protein
VLFIAGPALGGALGSGPIALVGVIGSVVAFIYAMYLSLRVIRGGDPRLLKRGVRGIAVVLKAHATNTVMQAGEFAWRAPRMWKYGLRVTLPNSEPYETDCNICAELGVGQQVQVAAAPHNRKRVTIDVGQGQARGRRTDATSSSGAGDPELAELLAMEAAEAARAPREPAADAQAAAADPVKRLQALADLHDRGALTDAEFALAKSRILSES